MVMARFVVSLCLLALVASSFAAPANNAKVHSFLRKTLETKSRVNVLVSMKESTETTLKQLETRTFSTRSERANAVYTSLKALADNSQAATLEMLRSPRFFAINVRSFWITNQIYIQGADQYLIDSLTEMDDVSLIEEEEIVYLQESAADPQEENKIQAEWGIERIQAEEAWAALGSQGEGAVIGIIDTGARYTHSLLIDSYKGGEHSWYNPYVSTANPSDGNGHGTHITGTIAGSGGIGVAPGAKWIACKGLRDDGSGTNAALIACAQFITCPHDYQGKNPDCAEPVDVCSNSWGGGSGSSWLDDLIRTWHAVGVIPVFAGGGSGPACRTIGSPADSAADVIAVGATTDTDAIASFSPRGPSNSGALKPNVCAPGSSIRSAGHTSDTAYTTISGTSPAAPHVAGLVALLRSADPTIKYEEVKNIIQDNADRNLTFSGQVCSDISDSTFPNYTFGYGRINALRSVKMIQALKR